MRHFDSAEGDHYTWYVMVPWKVYEHTVTIKWRQVVERYSPRRITLPDGSSFTFEVS